MIIVEKKANVTQKIKLDKKINAHFYKTIDIVF